MQASAMALTVYKGMLIREKAESCPQILQRHLQPLKSTQLGSQEIRVPVDGSDCKALQGTEQFHGLHSGLRRLPHIAYSVAVQKITAQKTTTVAVNESRVWPLPSQDLLSCLARTL